MEPLLIDSNNTKLSRYIHAQPSASAFTGQGGKHIVPNQRKKKKHKQKNKQKNKTKSKTFWSSFLLIKHWMYANKQNSFSKTIVLKNV